MSRSSQEVKRRHIILLERLCEYLNTRESKPEIVVREIAALRWAIGTLKQMKDEGEL